MNYLSVGSNYISQELFLNIKNTHKCKPSGGIWATVHNIEYTKYNEWVDFLCKYPHLLFYRHLENFYNLPAVYLSLKSNASILTIDNTERINYLKTHYPFNNWIDFEALAKDYDGIFVNLSNLKYSNNPNIQKFVKDFSVNTLIIFNLECIDYYQKALIDLSKVSLGNASSFPEYTIKIESEKHIIGSPSIEILTLIEIIKKHIQDIHIEINQESYEIIKSIFQDSINEVLKNHDVLEKDMLLIRKVFNQF